jgi:hypothetical protein
MTRKQHVGLVACVVLRHLQPEVRSRRLDSEIGRAGVVHTNGERLSNAMSELRVFEGIPKENLTSPGETLAGESVTVP